MRFFGCCLLSDRNRAFLFQFHLIWNAVLCIYALLTFYPISFMMGTQYTIHHSSLCIFEQLLSFEMNVNACALAHTLAIECTQKHCPIIRCAMRAINIIQIFETDFIFFLLFLIAFVLLPIWFLIWVVFGQSICACVNFDTVHMYNVHW